MNLRCAPLIVAAVMAYPIGDARAGDGSFPFVSFGGLSSIDRRADDTGLLVGEDDHSGTGDGFRFDLPAWIGAYGDIAADLGTGTGRASFGPEVGLLVFGLDGGLVRELGGTGRWGAAGRLGITFPVSLPSGKPGGPTMLTLYGRTVKWNGSDDEEMELGLLVKYALPFSR